MAINQPIFANDPADNSWKLEVTQQVNNEEARLNNLVSRIEQLEAQMGTGGGVVRQVDQTGILRLTNGILSNAPISTTGNLTVTNYILDIVTDSNNIVETVYTFSSAPNPIPDSHFVFLGGQKLIETSNAMMPRDYTISGNTITLNSTSTNFNLITGLVLELTVLTTS